jgi:antitoxin component YwqK of YwqJK toxin-antitoxin module
MKKYLPYLILLLFLSCQKKDYKNENWSDGSLKEIFEKNEIWNYGKTELISTEYKIKFYKEGIKDSSDFYKIEEYYDNGQISLIEFYVNGVRNGKSESWYKNGQKAGEMFYANGELHEKYTTWMPDGNLLEQFNYDKGNVSNE